MKVLVYNGPRRLAIEERAIPQPGAGEALLRVSAAGICGSELEGYLGQSSLRVPPLIMGHEFSGEVIALGPGEDTASAIPVGTKVTANPLLSCGTCVFCQAQAAHICPQRRLIGAHLSGAYGEYVAVPLSALIPLPETLAPSLAALAEPFAVALHGVALARVRPDDGIVVWGAGSIGLLAICAARQARPAQLIAVDTNPARLEAAREMGASLVLDAREKNVSATIRASLAGIAHTSVLDAVGRAATRTEAVAAAGPGGTVILLGLHDKETTFDVQGLIRQEVMLHGSYAYTRADMLRAVELLAAGVVQPGPWLDHRPLAQGPEAFAELVDHPGTATKILLIP